MRTALYLFVAGLSSLTALSAGADPVPPLIQFQSDTPALAAEVNQNFDDVKNSVDGNAADVSQLQSDLAGKQEQVSGSCPSGSSIRVIAPDGSVTCETDDTAAGDITGVTVGPGLSGGGTTGTVNLQADTTFLQQRVADSCPRGSAISAVASDGSVTCELLAEGTITGVSAGAGLTGGGSAGGVSLGIAPSGVTGTEILDGAITNADISAVAAIAASKISGDVGIEFATFAGCNLLIGTDTAIKDIFSIALTAPTTGNVLVLHSGFLVFSAENRTVSVGIGTSAAAIDFGSLRIIGDLDGTAVGRYETSYTSVGVFAVNAGTTTFHALAQGNTVFDTGNVNICPRVLAAVFIPKRY